MRSRPRCEHSPTAPRRHGGRPEPSRRCSCSRRSRRCASRPGPSDDRSDQEPPEPDPHPRGEATARCPRLMGGPDRRRELLGHVREHPHLRTHERQQSAAVHRRAPAPAGRTPRVPPDRPTPSNPRPNGSDGPRSRRSRCPAGPEERDPLPNQGFIIGSGRRGRARYPAHPRRSSRSGIARRRRPAVGSSRALRGRPPSRGGRRGRRGGGARRRNPGGTRGSPDRWVARSTSLIGRPSRIGTRVPRGGARRRGRPRRAPRCTAIASSSEVNTFVIEPISKTARSGTPAGSGSGPRDTNAVSSPSVALTTRRPGRRPARRSAASTRAWSPKSRSVAREHADRADPFEHHHPHQLIEVGRYRQGSSGAHTSRAEKRRRQPDPVPCSLRS